MMFSEFKVVAPNVIDMTLARPVAIEAMWDTSGTTTITVVAVSVQRDFTGTWWVYVITKPGKAYILAGHETLLEALYDAMGTIERNVKE